MLWEAHAFPEFCSASAITSALTHACRVPYHLSSQFIHCDDCNDHNWWRSFVEEVKEERPSITFVACFHTSESRRPGSFLLEAGFDHIYVDDFK